MKQSLLCLLLSALTAAALPPNLAQTARLSASSAAAAPDGKYGTERLRDGSVETHWASAARAPLPQSVLFAWDQPVVLDTVTIDIFASQMPTIYATWKQTELLLDGKPCQTAGPIAGKDFILVRLPEPRTVRTCELRIAAVQAPRTYVGINEVGLFLDPDRRIRAPRELAAVVPRESLRLLGRSERPCVYFAPADVARACRNAVDTAWGRDERAKVLAEADGWLARTDREWLAFLPPPGACYAYGFTACPICGSSLGTWAGARCSWDKPGQVTCAKGHVLPDEQHPDPGTGFQAPDGRYHYLLGCWNAWVTEQWTRNAVPSLAHAYALTGDERYAERAAFFLDALASIYPESTSGSWDYPSRPPSGRFARPWYQVARNLVVFIEAYDLVYASPAFARPSCRPGLEVTFPSGPTPQARSVGTTDARGYSRPGMTRRENVDRNLVLDGGWYCYGHTFAGKLHNGHADYMRGALAAGALLGIEPFVENAIDGPYSIYAMLRNNLDRDGRYYETALGYALHTRNLYLTFVEPLRNWRSATRRDGIDLFANARMRRFYRLPELEMLCAGHTPNYGDASPDASLAFPGSPPSSRTDCLYAEHLFAHTTGAEKAEAGRLLAFLAHHDIEKARRSSPARRWLLYHAEPLPADREDAQFTKELSASHLFSQKGIAILRDGEAQNAQAALLRFGPSLNHGDFDDLGLVYYAKGRQMLYEIGYGLGSTHTQVGWGSQTASHAIVTIDETSQSGGSGGSLRLFASLPGLQLVEAESPLSYANRQATLYRRTVALLGAGDDQLLVDLFRVCGGKQHDYGFGVQTREVTTSGIDFGPEQDGSLAAGVAWGDKIGRDGDIRGYPNKPYWNPPPGNGYGFFVAPRRAAADAPFLVDFALGGRNHARLQAHPLPEPGTTAILAKAPGLYPRNPAATYLLLRRQAGNAPLTSTFATVFASVARTSDRRGLGRTELAEALVGTNAETKEIASLDVFLLKGSKAGDFVEFSIDVPADGEYVVAADLLRAPSYGTTLLRIDGKPLGQPYIATNETIDGPHRVLFGALRLAVGTHRLRFEMQAKPPFFLGVSSLAVSLAADPPPPTRAPASVEWVRRLPVRSPDPTACGVHIRRNQSDELLLSAEGDGPHQAETCFGPVRWQGAVVLLKGRDGQLAEACGVGAAALRVGERAVGPAEANWEGTVETVDHDRHTVVIRGNEPLPRNLATTAVFSSPSYSRTTAYRVHELSNTDAGRFLLDLGDQSTTLGHGRVHSLLSHTQLTTDIPHEYARSVVGGTDSRFFDGKTIRTTSGATTRIQRLQFGAPMSLTVESTEGLSEGDEFVYLDIVPGDRVAIPNAWRAR